MISPVKIWRNQKEITKMLGKIGTILAWTIIRVPPTGFMKQAPYPLALITFDDHTHIMVQVVDCDGSNLEIGTKVRLVVRKTIETTEDGIIPYGIKAKTIQ